MVRRRHLARASVSAAALAACGAVIAGCGGSSHPSTASKSGPSKGVSFVRAADVSAAAAGYRLQMTVHATAAGQNVDMNASGSFTPKSHEASMTINMSMPALGSQSLQMQMVLAGGTMYMKLPSSLGSKLPGAKPWLSLDLSQMGKALKIPGYGSLLNSSSSMSDPGQYLDYLKAASNTVQNLGQATVGGVQTTHYRAQLDFSKLPDAVPAAERPAVRQMIKLLQSRTKIGQIPVDAWIDGSNLVRRIELKIDGTVNGQTLSEAITLNISDYGAQPAPTVPSPDQTTNLLSLMNGASLGALSGSIGG